MKTQILIGLFYTTLALGAESLPPLSEPDTVRESARLALAQGVAWWSAQRLDYQPSSSRARYAALAEFGADATLPTQRVALHARLRQLLPAPAPVPVPAVPPATIRDKPPAEQTPVPKPVPLPLRDDTRDNRPSLGKSRMSPRRRMC